MSSLNKVQLIGRLGQDPELKNMPNGDAVVTLSVATSEKWKDKNGEVKEETEWHRVVMFGRQAEVCGQYLKKGSMAYFEGKNKTRKWTDKEGVDRYTTEVKAHEMKMLDSRGGGRDSNTEGSRTAAAPAQRSQAPARQAANPDDDIPF